MSQFISIMFIEPILSSRLLMVCKKQKGKKELQKDNLEQPRKGLDQLILPKQIEMDYGYPIWLEILINFRKSKELVYITIMD